MKARTAMRSRRGVLLLIVLGLLAMFGVVAIAFVIVTGQQRRAAEVTARIGQYDEHAEKILDDAFRQVVRGSVDHRSPLQPHSLLEDLYGTESWEGSLPMPDPSNLSVQPATEVPSASSPQIIELVFSQTRPEKRTPPPPPLSPQASRDFVSYAVVGNVLTFLNGVAQGKSTHIVGCRYDLYDVTNNKGVFRLQVEAVPGVASDSVVTQINNQALNTQNGVAGAVLVRCMINGRVFSGTGFGYNPPRVDGSSMPAPTPPSVLHAPAAHDPALLNDAIDGYGWLYALMPNAAAFPYESGQPGYRSNSNYNNWLFQPDPAGPGGANDDYDAVDFQNMLLAEMLPGGDVPVPSLHRPELVDFWMHATDVGLDNSNKKLWALPTDTNKSPEVDLGRVLRRKVMLRPAPEEHSVLGMNYNYANPAHIDFSGHHFNPLDSSTWDVDTNGDCKPDSVWVDLGLPVRSMADGRQYKPLVAVLCVDLDGRLNLNAHGCIAQLQPEHYDPTLTVSDTPTSSPGTGSTVTAAAGTFRFASTPTGAAASEGVLSATLPRGQGFGPADVNLFPSLGNFNEYKQLLLGSWSDTNGNGTVDAGEVTVDGRYGESNLRSTTDLTLPSPGYSQGTFAEDLLSANKHFDYPKDYRCALGVVAADLDVNVRQGYGTPPDIHAAMAIGLDCRGQPIYCMPGTAASLVPSATPYKGGNPALLGSTAYWSQGRLNNPYEIDLSRDSARGLTSPASVDNPFSPSELERILRPYDRDTAELPSRLVKLAPSLSSHPTRFTTESWSLDTPAMPATLKQRDAMTIIPAPLPPPPASQDPLAQPPPVKYTPTYPSRVRDLSDLIRAEILRLDTSHALTDSQIQTRVRDLLGLLPAELLMGQRMDINRRFGNGEDSDALNTAPPNDAYRFDGVIDEPDETLQGHGAPNEMGSFFRHKKGASEESNPTFDLDNDGTAGPSNEDPRLRYIRGLYILGMLYADQFTPSPEFGPVGTDPEKEATRARMIAQWAVNVADYRDRDSIMTPFEYDIHPFTVDGAGPGTWNVDGRIGTPTNTSSDDTVAYRGLVWGCERPELLITETLAYHMNRTKDSATDSSGIADHTTKNVDLTKQDADFDQVAPPIGALFIELFNPWGSNQTPPGEFYYDHANKKFLNGVSLDKRAPVATGQTSGAPIWRLAIGQATPDPDSPATPLTIERSIYFTSPENTGITGDGAQYFPRLSGQPGAPTPPDLAPVPLPPNRYAVIGSKQTAGIPFNKNKTVSADTPRLFLDPLDPTDASHSIDNPANPPVRFTHNANGTNNDLPPATGAGAEIRHPLAIAVTGPNGHRLSVSEPAKGAYYPALPSGETEYPIPYDTPFDKDTTTYTGADPNAFGDSTAVNYRVIYLQRLANPLEHYDENANPYRTIDSMSIDLIRFNGETEEDKDILLESRQRGDTASTAGNADLWKSERNSKSGSTTTAAPDLMLHRGPLKHTLGYLNSRFREDASKNAIPLRTTPEEYVGDPPGKPFPWLNWNNRHFTSPMELLFVSSWPSSLLLPKFADAGSDRFSKDDGFSHVANIFRSEKFPNAGTTPPDPDAPPLLRVLEYLGTPSPFVGVETQGDPTAFATGTNHLFHPPFNNIPRYRVPGKINLNTIFDPAVWTALTYNGLDSPGRWADFVRSRRAYNTASSVSVDDALKTNPNADIPTRFANPFRSFEGAHLVPTRTMLSAVDREINSTILRQNPSTPTETLMAYTGNADPAKDAQRNPFFRYQPLTHLGNVVTTQSNVYAVWITVGYFEVERVGPETIANDAVRNLVYPDGYKLKQELGSDTGDIKRHRAFYIFDRSIPMAFQRGQDMNMSNGVLVSRIIE